MLVIGITLLAGLLFFALYTASLASQRYEQEPYSEEYYYGDPQYQTRFKRSKFDGNIFVLIFHIYAICPSL